MYTKLLVPLDGAELSTPAIQGSIALARQLGAGIAAFIAEPTLPLPAVGRPATLVAREQRSHDAQTEAHASGVLDAFEAQARAAGVPYEGHFARTDHIGEAICAAATEHGCDLIFMVTHGRGAFGELLFGSHTKRVMALSKLPLLVMQQAGATSRLQ